MFPESARRTLYHINTSATFADVFIFICTPFPTCTVLASERGRYNARRKIPAMDSTRSTAIAGTFLLAEVGIRVITIKPLSY